MQEMFSKRLWIANATNYRKIVEHPFNVELSKGILSKERFLFFIQQDVRYLLDFSKVMTLIADRSSCPNQMNRFLRYSKDAIKAQSDLCSQYLGSFFSSSEVNPSCACFSYSQYLFYMARSGTIEEAIASVIPCLWLYKEVGYEIWKNKCNPNPYDSWIQTYLSEEVIQIASEAEALLNEIANNAPVSMLQQIEQVFITSSLFEWHFWNDAYLMRYFDPSFN